jgi:hypothetical protein
MRSLLSPTVTRAGQAAGRSCVACRLVVLLLAAALLGACGRAQLLYDNADWLIYRWAVDLVDADSAQKAVWRGRFETLMDEHREQLLPRVVGWLEEVERQAGRGLDAQRLDCLIEQTDALYRDHARLVVPIAVDILGALSPQQQDHLAQRLAERNEEYVEEYLDPDPDTRRALRIERYIERVERWTGTLTAAQRTTMAEAIELMPDTAEPWFAYRQAQQGRLLELLRAGASRDELNAFLQDWWVDLDDRPASLVTASDAVKRRSLALTLQIDADLDNAQRAHLVSRVDELRGDLQSAQTLTASAAPPRAPRCG